MVAFIGESSQVAGSGSTTSIDIPPHQAGDLILMFAFRSGSTGPPNIPEGWTDTAATGGNNNCSTRVAYRIATGPGTESGTWTYAHRIIGLVYRSTGTLSVGTAVATGAQSATITTPAIEAVPPNAWVVTFAGHRNAITLTHPAGYVHRATSAGNNPIAAGYDTAAPVGSVAAATITSPTSSGWRTAAIPIIETGGSGEPPTAEWFAWDGTTMTPIEPLGALLDDGYTLGVPDLHHP